MGQRASPSALCPYEVTGFPAASFSCLAGRALFAAGSLHQFGRGVAPGSKPSRQVGDWRLARQRLKPYLQRLYGTGATGLEPATSGVTGHLEARNG